MAQPKKTAGKKETGGDAKKGSAAPQQRQPEQKPSMQPMSFPSVSSMASKVVSTLQSAAQPAGKAAAPSGTPSAITRTYGERIFTGIKGFDTLLGNGIPYGSAVLIEGGPGSGKTIFCLTMAVNHCMKGKRVLYMSFEEPEERLISHMESFGWNPRKLITDGLLRIKRFNALDVARSVEALLSEAKKELLIEVDPVFFPRDFKPDIVLIDSMTSISSAFSGEESRFRIYMEQLFRYLEKENISSFLIREVANPTHTGAAREEHVGEAVSFLSDGIIIIYNVLYPSGQRGVAIEVLKMRGTPIVKKIVRMEITSSGGVTVFPDEQIPATCKLT